MKITRHTQSKTKIRQALLTLLTEKDFEKITVADLTRTAKVNRGTFYLHYIDKYDLLNQLVEEFKMELQAILTNPNLEAKTGMIACLTHLKSEALFVTTITQKTSRHLTDEVTNFMMRVFKGSPEFREQILSQSRLPKAYQLAGFSHYISGLISLWIQRQFKESPHEIMEMIMVTIERHS